jgi:CHRD domain
MKKTFISVLVVLTLGLVLFAGPNMLMAQPNPTVQATLSSFEETPQTLSTPGTGSFRAKISPSVIEYELSYANTDGTVLVAHIHLGRAATTGGVIAFLCGGGGKPACPEEGTVTGTIVAADIIGPAGQGIAAGEFDEAVLAILAGATYVNVHTDLFPGGEIRGIVREKGDRSKGFGFVEMEHGVD